jgi:DNA polymerase-3 subunit alpha
MLSYQTAWLKVNHPDIFYAALLSVEYGDQDKVAEYIQDARRYGIKILPPDINKSQREFAIADGVIYFGLSAIKSLGVGAIDVILEARQERQFDDLIDITQRISKGDLNSRALGMLIKAGALDALGDRSQQLASIDVLRKPLPKRNPKPRELVDDYTPYTPIELLKLERDAIGLYVSGNPLDSYQEFKAARSSTIAGLNDWCDTQPSYYQNRVRGIVAGTISQITKIQTKRGQTMAKLLIEDETAVVEVIVFAGEWEQMANSAVIDGSALFHCDITPDDDNGSPKLVGKRILTHDDLVCLPRIAFITLDMVWVDTNTLETLAEDFRGTTEDARAIVRIDTGYDIVSMDLGDLRVPKDLGDKLATHDGITVSYTYDPKALLQFVGAR